MFNEFINHYKLREIARGPQYTWTNNQVNPVLVKLDKFLVSTEWEERFPLCFSKGLTRVGSDHCPIVLDSGENNLNKSHYFFFENNWLLHQGFRPLISQKWTKLKDRRPEGSYSMDGWHGSLVSIRRFLRGWNRQKRGEQNKIKHDLLLKLKNLDAVLDMNDKLPLNWNERYRVERKLEQVYHMEEVYWQQRAGKNWFLKGDSNSSFFHLFANGRRRKNNILHLVADSCTLVNQKDIRNHVVDFYKNLFGPSIPCAMKVHEDFWEGRSELSTEETIHLIRPFDEEEIKQAIGLMHVDSAPGPNGFGVAFFKNFWYLIKGDLMKMFRDFHGGNLDIQRLNYATSIKQYRPICLLNVDFTIFTKGLSNRLSQVAKVAVGGNQTVFIKNRNILEGVVILPEVIHDLKLKKRGLILKIDFEKAYDKVRWDFFS
jgi:hypothetical protein